MGTTTRKKSGSASEQAPAAASSGGTVVDLAPTPVLDALTKSLLPVLSGTERWVVEGWAAHARHYRHQIHAANSWSLHRHEHLDLEVAALTMRVTIARMVDFGLTKEEALTLLRDRVRSHEAKKAEAIAKEGFSR